MLPKDSNILLSVINTYLRDAYPTLDTLCNALGVNKEEIEKSLAKIGYTYDERQNRFK